MSMYTTSMCVIKKHQNELDKAFSLYKMTINVFFLSVNWIIVSYDINKYSIKCRKDKARLRKRVQTDHALVIIVHRSYCPSDLN